MPARRRDGSIARTMTNPILWSPDERRLRASLMHALLNARQCDDYDALHRWSVTDPAAFWSHIATLTPVALETVDVIVSQERKGAMTADWFPGARLNFAEQLLAFEGSKDALVFRGEDGAREALSRDELRAAVARVAAGLRNAGVSAGDRVAAIMPNCPEAIVAMLAAASIGAIWSSCSPDFGIDGIYDRFGQIEPRVLICADGYVYNGKTFESLAAAAAVAERIPAVETLIVVSRIGAAAGTLPGNAIAWNDFGSDDQPLTFAALPFDHPLYILYSSGTTGAPKCIVHGAGGTLLQHLKEHRLHCDLREDDVLFYFTTCGWMMWNWLASGLASGATLTLFDGSPFAADGHILWNIAEEESISVFGTSAKFLSAQQNAGLNPARDHDLRRIHTLLSTGSPLAPAGFDYVYDSIGNDLLLASISGGTDIVSCFVLGNPLLPVRRGELQCAGLGMDVDVFDDDGAPVRCVPGELVCKSPFPSMPIGFWNDADGSRYRRAYFERYPNVWAHGDFAARLPEGGFVIHGRSDAVLNPGGVRIGTAEIYRQVESLDEIAESIAVGQRWDDDVRVILFVVLNAGYILDDALSARIRSAIRANTTPRHVPAKILSVPEIPRTRSGKIVELAVRSVIHDEPVKNTEALANPDALDYFRSRPELDRP